MAARRLLNQNIKITVLIIGDPKEIKGDALKNYEILIRLKNNFPNKLKIEILSGYSLSHLKKPSLIIDAIYGTGFKGSLTGGVENVVEWINSKKIPVISTDVPSGVDASTGVVENMAVKADRTFTLAFPKIGLYCCDGREHSGQIEIIDIGIPRDVIALSDRKTFLTTQKHICSILPKRRYNVNKYTVGKVYVLGGAKGFTGAAALCAESVLKSGAGAVVLGTPDAIYPILAKKLTEAIIQPLPTTKTGSLSLGGLEKIRQRLKWADTLAIGPGLSTDPETQELIQTILKEYEGRCVIDADALNALSEVNWKSIKPKKSQWIFTPHAGELSRLIKIEADEIEKNKVSVTRKICLESGSYFVVKGAPTVIGSNSGQIYINTTGNPGMATVGSGDVLTGLIAGLWTQKMDAFNAAVAGVYIHGMAGDIARDKLGERSLMAGNILANIPNAFKKIEINVNS